MTYSRLFAVLIVVVVMAVSVPLAGQSLVYGPERFALDPGRASTHEVSIPMDAAMRCDGRAFFVLEAENDRVASAEVAVNGRTVLGTSAFNAAVTRLTAPLLLTDSNRLTVKLHGGAAGGSLTLSIRKEIDGLIAPPQVLNLSSRRQTFEQTITANPASRHVLVVENGTPPVAGTIEVNGATVATFSSSDVLLRREVVLQTSNHLRVDIRGDEGASVTISLREVLDESVCRPTVAITSPAADAVLTSSRVVVSGTTTGGRDAGVTVNGIAAEIDLSRAGTRADPYRWAAVIDAEEGPLTLVATVRTAAGLTATEERRVTVQANPEAMALIALTPAGVAPETVRFRLRNVPESATRYEVDYDGDGAFEVVAAMLPPLAVTYTTPGLRVVAVRVTNAAGAYIATAPVNVVEFGTIDVLLKQRWNAFRSMLAARDVAGAVQLISGDAAREKYGRAFATLADRLPAIATTMAPLDPVFIRGTFAEYLLTRIEDGREHGYYVYFVRDADGIWRIAQF